MAQLQIIQAKGNIKKIPLKGNVKYKIQPDEKYQLVDDLGNPIEGVEVVSEGQFVRIYQPNLTEPILVLEGEAGIVPEIQGSTLSFASKMAVATEVAQSGAGLSTLAWVGGGLLAAGGIGLAVGGGGSKGGAATPNSSANTNNNVEKPQPTTPEAPQQTQPTPTLTFDRITGDNVINAEEASRATVEITGAVKNLQENERLQLKIGNAVYTATVEGERFTAQVDGKTLAVHQQIQAEVVRDETAVANQSHHYDVKTELAKPNIQFNAIAEDNIINLTESQGDIQVSGQVQNAQEGDEVIVSCGCPICTGMQWVDIKTRVESGGFNVNFAGSQLTQNGYTLVKATVITKDSYGNTAIGEQTANYDVDLVAPAPSFVYTTIGKDNIINRQLSSETILLRGRVIDLGENETVSVSVKIGDQVFSAVKNEDYYETQVQGMLFAQSQQVEWTLVARDKAGNVNTITQSQPYRYDVELSEPQIQIEQMPETLEADNIQFTLSGKLSYDDDVKVRSVLVEILHNGHTYSAEVNGKTWTAVLPIEAVKAVIGENSLTITAKVTDTAGNTAQSAVEKTFIVEEPRELVDPEVHTETQLHFTEIGDNFSVSAKSDTVILRGKVNLNHGIFAQYHNADLVNAITIKLNEKTYTVALNSDLNANKEKTFEFAISRSELDNAAGQDLIFGLPEEKIHVYELKNPHSYNSLDREVKGQWATLSDQSKFTLEDNAYISGKKVQALSPEKVSVQGVITGNAVANGKVIVRVGDDRIEAEVDGNTFKADIDRNKLLLNSSKKLTATLTDTAGETHAFSSQQYHTSNLTGKKEITTPNIAINVDASLEGVPYFIKALLLRGNLGYLRYIPLGEKAELTYQFLNHRNGYGTGYNEANRISTRNALKLMESYANVKFTELDINAITADIQFVMRDISPANGQAHYGGPDVDLNEKNYQAYENHNGVGTRAGYQTTIHEVMHTMGAKHPFEGDYRLPTQENDKSLSVMSYTKGYMDTETAISPFDLAYLHFRFGVNSEHRSGNDTYRFRPFNPYSLDGDIYIWDGAGVDTFDASDQQHSVTVDLTPGSWIFSGEKTDRLVVQQSTKWDIYEFFNDLAHTYEYSQQSVVSEYKMTYTEGQAFIGYGTQIERLIGSNFDDILKGNVANNEIFGGSGKDQIWGGDGDDYLDGGNDADTMYGGKGNDIFVVNDAQDKIVEYTDEGTDSVYAHINYKLPDNVENLTLFGNAEEGIGNDLNNRIEGNDLANTLTGGGGKDIFVFNSALNGNVDTITDFNPLEDKIALSRAIFSDINGENLLTHITYNAGNGELRYEPTVSDAVTFAKISTDLEMKANWFVLA